MWKRVLILSISLCLFSGYAYAGALPNKQQSEQTQKQTKNKLTKKSIYVRYAKLFSVELNYNTISATLSYMPVYKYTIKGRTVNITVPNVVSNLKQTINLPIINSNAVKKAYYSYKNHALVITALLRKRFRKSQIKAISEGHILVIKFPTLKNRPVLSSQTMKAGHNYSIKKSKTVYVSLKNITMITTPYVINKIIYSKDQNIEITKSGNTAFVKILPLEEQKPSGRIKFLYHSSPRDIYIITPAGTYSLNLIPRHIPSLTIVLKTPQIPTELAGGGMKKPVFKQPVVNSGLQTNVSYYRCLAKKISQEPN